MKAHTRILLLASLLLFVSVGGICNLIWQLPQAEQMQDAKAVLRCWIFLGLFGAGLIFSVLELVRHEIISPIFQLAAQIIRLKERKTGDDRLEFTGNRAVDGLTRALNDLLAKRTEKENELEKKIAIISQFKDIINRSGCLVFIWRIEPGQWPVEFVSDNVADILGYTADDFISGRVAWPAITHPDDVPRLEKEVAGYLKQGARKWSQEYRLITKSGEIKWFYDENQVITDAAGKPEKIQAIAHDITDRKKMEARLEKINQCLLKLGADFNANVASITTLCGELLGGSCALYNRLNGQLFCAIGQWHTPPDFKPEDRPEGHICYDVIQGKEDLLFVPNLPATRYAETDPNVRQYGLQSYLGHKVRCENKTIGSLCVVFTHSFKPTENDKYLFSLMAFVVGMEEHRRLANLALQTSREKFRNLVETVHDWVWEMDCRGHYTYVSPRVKHILGYEPEELIGKTPFELMPPDEAKRTAKIFESMVRKQKPITVLESINLHKNGYTVILETSGLPFYDAKGNFNGYRGTDRDITARVKAEQKAVMLLRAIDTAHQGCLLIMADYRIVFANTYSLTKLGFEFDELKDLDLFSLFIDREKLKNIIETAQIARRWMGEITVAQKDGKHFPAFVSVAALEGHNLPDESAYILLFQDITHQKEMREKLLSSEKLAVMGRMVADVAHELNNPLAIIIGGTQLILKQLGENEKELQNQLERILRNGKRCKTILSNLLTYSRTIAKKSELVNIHDLIHETIDSVSFQYDMSGIDTTVNCDKLCNVNVAGNRAALLSVFINLVRNARQAMGTKGSLTINLKQIDDSIRVEISDTGVGMSREQIETLFKPFISGWQEVEGSGLGLATSLGIIETHGGKITAFSNGMGQGTTFVVTLPYSLKEDKIFSE